LGLAVLGVSMGAILEVYARFTADLVGKLGA
jgi:hypothetical protein